MSRPIDDMINETLVELREESDGLLGKLEGEHREIAERNLKLLATLQIQILSATAEQHGRIERDIKSAVLVLENLATAVEIETKAAAEDFMSRVLTRGLTVFLAAI
jgi:hypothetical protein